MSICTLNFIAALFSRLSGAHFIAYWLIGSISLTNMLQMIEVLDLLKTVFVTKLSRLRN